MRLHTILCALLTIKSIEGSEGKTDTLHISEEIVDLRGHTPTVSLPEELPYSIIDCSRRCLLYSRCFAFSYNGYTRKCQLFWKFLDMTPPSSQALATGDRFYRVKGRRLVAESCVSWNDECIVPNSECRSEGVCGCVAGYSFLPGSHTCENGCNTYGSTFQSFSNHAITGFNEDIISSITLDQSKQSCINATGYTCVSFDFEPATNRCALASVSALDVPASYDQYSQRNHYQRNCA